MKKTLTMTAYNRPEYLRQTLEQLRKNDFTDWSHIKFGIEPGNVEVARVAESAREFIYAFIRINNGVLGVKNNPFMTLKSVFRPMKKKVTSNLNIYLEDDVLFSPDITRLANWYGDLSNKNDYLCMGFFRKDTLEDVGGVKVEHNPKMFSALGLVITDYQWDNYFAPNWHKDPRGWDWSMKGFMESSGLGMLVPMVSRSYHIGRENATHYVPSQHDSVHVGVKWNQDPYQGEYTLHE
jgi:hypothetical protein